jgi:carbon monoxide dehydrogenase subunit G
VLFLVESRRNNHRRRMRALRSPALRFLAPRFRVHVALLFFLLAASGARGADVSVEARRRGEALEVLCRATLDAPLDLIWGTLTDFDRLAEFIPGMRSSRVVSREGEVSVVEQSGEARFLFVSYPIEVTLHSTERPPHVIEARLVKGNLKRLDGTYRVEPRDGGRMLLTWSGVVEAESMPPLIGELLMRGTIEDQFRGMVREIERRDAVRREREREAKR